jgi:hypothetical protein
MSSGYFPLDRKYSEGGRKLVELISKLKEMSSEYHGYACELDCTEDGVSDGGYLERISIAIEMLNACLEKEQPNA